MIGQTISHYKILEKLGEGGMGVVYKAQDTKLLRPVALKFLSPEMTRDQDAKKRFIQEARAASALDHPNIAVVHDIDEAADGHSFICMAYYDGQTLKAKLATAPLSIDEAVRITLQIASGLQRAHDSGIVHRDIKPGNIIITSQGEVKIVDFGLAKLAAQTRESRSQITGGTAAYMAPEQILGNEADARSDLFSLGVVLYEAATGRRPFVGEHEAALFYSIVNAEPLPPSTVRADMPQELERIILRSLEKDPKKRYQSAGDLREDLKHFLGEKPTPRPVRQLRKALRGRFSVPIMVGAAVVIATAILFTSGVLQKWFGSTIMLDNSRVAVLPFTNIGGDSSKKALTAGLFEIISRKLAQLHSVREEFFVFEPGATRKITSAYEAYRTLNATIAVDCSFKWDPSQTEVTISLEDAKTSLVIDSKLFKTEVTEASELESELIDRITEMIGIKLTPADVLGLAARSTKNEDVYKLYLEARGHLQQYPRAEELNAAINLFQRAILIDARYLVALAGLGEAYWRKYQITKDTKWVDSAIATCARADTLDRKIPEIHLTLGMIYRGTGNYRSAINELQTVLAADSLNADAYRELGDAYQDARDSAKAEACYKKAIDLRSKDWRGYNYLGKYYYNLERNTDAIEMWKKVAERAPDIRTGYNNLGAAYFRLERWRESIEQFELSIQKDTNNYPAYSNLGTAYYYDGLLDRAVQAYEKALKLNRTDYVVWGGLGATYRELGSKKLAQETYETAIRLAEEDARVNPQDAGPISQLAGYYADVGRKVEARSLLLKAVLLASDNADVLKRVGMAYELLGDREQALRWIGHAVKKGCSTTEIRYSPEMKGLREDPRYAQLKRGGGEKINKK